MRTCSLWFLHGSPLPPAPIEKLHGTSDGRGAPFAITSTPVPAPKTTYWRQDQPVALAVFVTRGWAGVCPPIRVLTLSHSKKGNLRRAQVIALHTPGCRAGRRALLSHSLRMPRATDRLSCRLTPKKLRMRTFWICSWNILDTSPRAPASALPLFCTGPLNVGNNLSPQYLPSAYYPALAEYSQSIHR